MLTQGWSGKFTGKVPDLCNAMQEMVNGTGQELRKIITVSGSDLFEPIYNISNPASLPIYYYTLTGVTSKVYYPTNLELVPWDLEQYGSAWKFIVSEYDPSEEVTTSVTNSSTYGTNFGLDVTGIFGKLGAKFGVTTTSSSSTTYTYKTTTGSDELGEGILDFRSPIVTGVPITGIATTYEVTTGRISMSVEPKRVY